MSYIRHIIVDKIFPPWFNPHLSPYAGMMEKIVFQPLYRQTEALLTQALMAGEWEPGGLIPSEAELALRFGVSQGTIRKAIESLRAEKLLVRRQGRGTYVATHREESTQFRFLKLRPDDRPPRALRSQYLDCQRKKCPSDIARKLGIGPRGFELVIRRLLVEDAPKALIEHDPPRPNAQLVGRAESLSSEFRASKILVFEEIHLPAERFPGLSFERLSAYSGPLYGLLESEFGVRLVGGTEELKAVIGPSEVCSAMNIKPSTPLLFVDRLTESYDRQPVEVRRAYYLNEGYHYYSKL
jgi:GntR family transcriptional regulator